MTHRYLSTRARASRLVTICVLLGGTAYSGATEERSSAPARSSSPSRSTSAPSPRALPGTEAALQAGTYLVDGPFRIPLTVTTTAGWSGYVGKYGYFAEVGPIFFLIFDKVMADPCDSTKGYLTPQPGPTADDLATALAAQRESDRSLGDLD